MAKKGYKPEQIINKLREAELQLQQGATIAAISKAIGDTKAIIQEHEEIRKQANNAIRLAENAVYNKLGQEELNQSALNIREIFKRICELIEEHTSKEDRLLNSE